MIIPSQFIPAKGLANSHVQTMLPALLRRKRGFMSRRQRLELPDGDFAELDWVGEGVGPIIIILPGIAGSMNAPYVIGLANEILQRHWRGVMLNYRGRGSELNVLDRSYHLGDTLILDTLVDHLHEIEPDTPKLAVGYSMGGNILLKWMGDTKESVNILAGVAVSTPFDIRIAANHMRHEGRMYQWWLLGRLQNHIQRKYQYRKAPIDFSPAEIKRLKSFWEFDDRVTAPLNGFKDAIEYYHKSSSRWVLKDICKPVLAINSKDDPFMTEKTLPNTDELSASVQLELSEKGGHVGFVEGTLLNPKLWLEKRIPAYLEEQLALANRG